MNGFSPGTVRCAALWVPRLLALSEALVLSATAILTMPHENTCDSSAAPIQLGS